MPGVLSVNNQTVAATLPVCARYEVAAFLLLSLSNKLAGSPGAKHVWFGVGGLEGGQLDVLGCWAASKEAHHTWRRVWADLAERGLDTIRFLACEPWASAARTALAPSSRPSVAELCGVPLARRKAANLRSLQSEGLKASVKRRSSAGVSGSFCAGVRSTSHQVGPTVQLADKVRASASRLRREVQGAAPLGGWPARPHDLEDVVYRELLRLERSFTPLPQLPRHGRAGRDVQGNCSSCLSADSASMC